MTNRNLDQNRQSITELFHTVRRLLPANQQVVTVDYSATVSDALTIMRQHDFSQLPIVSGDSVLSVFSQRELGRKLVDMGHVKIDFHQLPVGEFGEPPRFVQSTDNWESTLPILNRQEWVLVGSHHNLQGILTTMDVLQYMNRVAKPFVLLAEIELSLRRIIEACTKDEQTLQACIERSVKEDRRRGSLRLNEMTFMNFVMIIVNKANWMHFERVLGEGEGARQVMRHRLERVGKLRNIIFHFKQSVTQREHDYLIDTRELLQAKARMIESHTVSRQQQSPALQPNEQEQLERMIKRLTVSRRQQGLDSQMTSRPRVRSRKTSRNQLLSESTPIGSQMFSTMLEWTSEKGFEVKWGTKSAVIRVNLASRMYTFAYCTPPDMVEIYFHNQFGLESKQIHDFRRKWLQTGLLYEAGEKTLRVQVSEDNYGEVRDLVSMIFADMAMLSARL